MNEFDIDESREKFPRWLIISGGLLVVGLVAVTYGMMQLMNSSESVEIIHADEKTEMIPKEILEKKIKIDIAGAVVKPGLYEVINTARVADVIKLAEGLKDTAHVEYVNKQLNLAEIVRDGQKIYIPFADEQLIEKASLGQVSGVKNGMININTATMAELDSLAGIGETRAQKIIENRPYSTIEELVAKEVLTQTIFDKISQEITVAK